MRTFLAKHPVFTRDELEDSLQADHSGNSNTANSRLAHHVRAGHVIQIQRGLYASVPTGTDPASLVPDPWLVASRLAKEAAIAYHSSFQFHGRAYTVSSEYVFVSNQTMRPMEFRGCRFRRVSPPKALLRDGKELFGIETVDRLGHDIHVASLERSLVDILDRPDLGGGWEEIWRYRRVGGVLRHPAGRRICAAPAECHYRRESGLLPRTASGGAHGGRQAARQTERSPAASAPLHGSGEFWTAGDELEPDCPRTGSDTCLGG